MCVSACACMSVCAYLCVCVCVRVSNLEHGDVPGVALHGLLQLAALQALPRPDPVEVHVEVQP